MISSEARTSIIGGIEAVSLGRLHAKAIVEPHPPGKDIVLAQCVVAAMTKEAGKEQGGGIPPSRGLSHRLTMEHGECHCPTAATGPHPWQKSIQKSNNITCDGSTSLKLAYIYIVVTIFMTYYVVTMHRQIIVSDCCRSQWSYRQCRAPAAAMTTHILCICPPSGFVCPFCPVAHLREHGG
jgi:hypothetical protein